MNLNVVVGLRALLVGSLALAVPAHAQQQPEPLRVSIPEENLRQSPGGTLIAVLLEDARLSGGEKRGQWREVELDAWVREDAVRPTTRDGHDLAIASSDTPLYDAPDGTVVGRGRAGFLLDEVSRSDGWIQVTRTGWIWAASTSSAPPTGTSPAPGESRTIHPSPSEPPFGTIAADVRLEVVGEEGEWARVRLEGWVKKPAGSEVNPTGPIQNLSLRALRDNPDLYRGRTIAWRVQYVAIQRADSLRSDLEPGERYILARDPGGEPGYVYIAVPPALLADVRRLVPLQQIEVVGRVRTGRSAIMGHPVLDLMELRSVGQP